MSVSSKKVTITDETIGQRLRRFAVSRFGSVTSLAKELKISQPRLSSYLAGTHFPPMPVLEKLAAIGCDVQWLVTGENPEGQMTKRTRVEYRIEATVPAGVAEMTDRSDWPEWEAIDYNPEHYFWLEVSTKTGESMGPAIEPGDKVLLSVREKPKPGNLCAASWAGVEAAIKVFDEGAGRVMLTSLNPTVRPVILRQSKVKVYKVVLIKKK